MYASSRIIGRRTLNDLYCQYFLPEVMVKFTRKARGHFVTFIESGMHLIKCISGHNYKSEPSAHRQPRSTDLPFRFTTMKARL